MKRRRCNYKIFLSLAILSTALLFFQISILESSRSSSETTRTGTRTKRDEWVGVTESTGRHPLLSNRDNLQQGPIFYNLFVPNGDRTKDTQRIVKEQLLQRDLSSPNSTIRYTLIGNESFQDFVANECTDCQLQNHLQVGNEEHTLQNLWDFCQQHQVTNSTVDILVTYIHDKGSFHPTKANEKARRMATKAAMECRTILPPNARTCNICMGAFHVFPQYLASANMWTARCSYIRMLYPPQNYSARLQQMYDTTLNHSVLQYAPQYVCLKPYHPAANFWGVGRYSLERWALSHPYVKPCTVLPIGERAIPGDEFPQSWTPKFRTAPRDSAKALGIETGPYKSTFARLPGRLFEWQFIYNQTPPSNSWIWRFYKGYKQGAPIFLKKCQAYMKNITR